MSVDTEGPYGGSGYDLNEQKDPTPSGDSKLTPEQPAQPPETPQPAPGDGS